MKWFKRWLRMLDNTSSSTHAAMYARLDAERRLYETECSREFFERYMSNLDKRTRRFNVQ